MHHAQFMNQISVYKSLRSDILLEDPWAVHELKLDNVFFFAFSLNCEQ